MAQLSNFADLKLSRAGPCVLSDERAGALSISRRGGDRACSAGLRAVTVRNEPSYSMRLKRYCP